jgi:hypothetical protein
MFKLASNKIRLIIMPANEIVHTINYRKMISIPSSVVEVFFENNIPTIYSLLHTWYLLEQK